MAEQAQLPAPEGDEDPPGERRMPFLEHLGELRDCLRNMAIGVVCTTGVAYAFRKYLFAILARPLIDAWVEAQKEVGIGKPELVFTSPIEAFMVLFKLSLLVGIFAASPFIFRELWRFISPGLYDRERKWGIAFIFSSVLL